MLVSALAWQQNEKIKHQKDIANYHQKVRNACYCDCASRKKKKRTKEDGENLDDTIERIKNKQKKDKTEKNQRGKIMYEGETSSSSLDCETEDDEEADNQCACLCHGMYNNNVVEDDNSEFVKPKRYLKSIFKSKIIFILFLASHCFVFYLYSTQKSLPIFGSSNYSVVETMLL